MSSWTVTPSPLVPLSSVPTDPSQVWDLSGVFLPSWAEGVTLESDWGGNVVEGQSGAEQRLCFTGRPNRTMKVTLKAFHQRETWQLINRLKRMAYCRCLMPLYCDSMQLTGQSGTLLQGEPAYRRFFPGGRVVIARPRHTPSGVGPECDSFETATVQSVTTGTGVTLTSGTVNSYGRGCLAWPCMEVEVAVPPMMKMLTDWHASVEVSCREVLGPQALPPWADDADLPLGYATYGGLPVFVPDDLTTPQDPTEATYGWHRTIQSNQTGIGDTYELIGSRPKAARSWSFYPYKRASTHAVMQFWDACSGTMLPFVSASPANPYAVYSVSASAITMDAGDSVLEDWQDFSLLAVKLRGQPVQVLPVASVADSSGVRTVNLTGALTGTLSPAALRWASPAHVMRFDGTTLTEKWSTTEHCALSLQAVELLDEASYSVFPS